MKVLAWWSLIAILGIFPQRAFAPPPPPFKPDLPGTTRGKSRTYWLAPYVKYTEETVGGNRSGSVTWYAEKKQIKSLGVDYVQPGFIQTGENGEIVYIGINEEWKVVRPPKANDIAPVWSSQDSHVLVRQESPDRQQIFEEIYVGGVVQPVIGPFQRYLGRNFQVGEDGSTAGIVWKDPTRKTTRLVVTDAAGRVSVDVDCEETDGSPIPGPNGAGALVPGKGGEGRTSFAWYTREGNVRAIRVTPNPNCVGWIPGTKRSLFSTSIGYDSRYRMIDWETGRELWNIACPAGGYALTIGMTPRIILFEVAELYKPGAWRGDGRLLEKNGTEWIRAFYAASTEDGHLVSHWRAFYGARLENYDHDRIVLLKEKLYYLSAEEFVELSEDDILNAKNGWER